MRRALAWTGVMALVVLGSRAIVYALAPSPLAAELSHRAGGPRLPVLAAAALMLALALSAAAVWLAALGVRERRLLETRRVLAVPRVRLGLLASRAVALWLVSMPAFAYLESYIHWRQGLGWHGLHCLIGPVHRNAIPVLGALSLLAAALAAAAEHVLAWMRRTIARLIASPRSSAALLVFAPASYEAPPTPVYAAPLGARGPPPRS
ncbi:MAG TPA: hypothetical protein VE688_01580 [Gaiellaceae bacterium]|jgi:hypothetical protein|nr:hypothetical protein [Gaiellaceae bacterium]